MADKLEVRVNPTGATVTVEGSVAQRLGDAVADALSPFTEGLGLIGDQVRLFRQQRLEIATQKLKTLSVGAKEDLHPVPPRTDHSVD